MAKSKYSFEKRQKEIAKKKKKEEKRLKKATKGVENDSLQMLDEQEQIARQS